ncbi:beta-ketoacyl-[acyl-carrier-protein] synthase family protein [uncultured Abyssibacter sp.]|uniref:beta-ketoacyl-[acyl-carrier-protein] synthase family protein n=1 Tax=uncultured Abyssibacter sp. TaxID=2320202 RepID=UPI0032B30667
MPVLAITAATATSSLGTGLRAHDEALASGRTGLRPASDIAGYEHAPGWLGAVDALADVALPEDLSAFDCRNNRLAWLGLHQDGFIERVRSAVDRHGPERVGVFLGTSTSGIAQTEQAYHQAADGFERLPGWYDYQHTHNVHSVSAFVARALEITGFAETISTACSSSAKVFAAAARAIRSGICDAAVVGGVDTLCETTLFGFHSLQLVSPNACRPADILRDGISIGEAGGFALVERGEVDAPWYLFGYGESSDAHHMSTPDPEGRGARAAMHQALARGALPPDAVDYVNLHGTGTLANDRSEARAVADLLGSRVPCSSTKGWTGHCLGAAGILEAVIGLLVLDAGRVPQSLNTESVDPELAIDIPLEPRERPVRSVLSNSFGFGGSNCSLLLGAAA